MCAVFELIKNREFSTRNISKNKFFFWKSAVSYWMSERWINIKHEKIINIFHFQSHIHFFFFGLNLKRHNKCFCTCCEFPIVFESCAGPTQKRIHRSLQRWPSSHPSVLWLSGTCGRWRKPLGYWSWCHKHAPWNHQHQSVSRTDFEGRQCL